MIVRGEDGSRGSLLHYIIPFGTLNGTVAAFRPGYNTTTTTTGIVPLINAIRPMWAGSIFAWSMTSWGALPTGTSITATLRRNSSTFIAGNQPQLVVAPSGVQISTYARYPGNLYAWNANDLIDLTVATVAYSQSSGGVCISVWGIT